MSKMLMVLGACMTLAGCASSTLKGYIGQPVSVAIEDYGMPSGNFDIDVGKKAFVWNVDSNYVIASHSETMPAIAGTTRCAYILYATQTRNDIEGPMAWTVTGFKKPKLDCE